MEIAVVNKKLTEREERFLESLFGSAKGDPKKAKMFAGYPQSMPVQNIVRSLKDEILEGTQLYLANNAPAAVMALVEILLSNDAVIDAKNKILAAKEILDRAGVVKTEKKEVTHRGGLALLPAKSSE